MKVDFQQHDIDSISHRVIEPFKEKGPVQSRAPGSRVKYLSAASARTGKMSDPARRRNIAVNTDNLIDLNIKPPFKCGL